MTLPVKTPLVFLAIMVLSLESMAYCKWTDENGTVHYADDCPGDAGGRTVELQPSPSHEQIEESQWRSQRIQQASQVQKSQREREAQQQSAKNQASNAIKAQMLNQCMVARRRLQTLGEQLSVYEDDQGEFHTSRSPHNALYEGPRRYLDDTQRREEILRYGQLESQSCNVDDADIQRRLESYVAGRNREVCRHLEARLASLQSVHTDTPTAEMRKLDNTVNGQCRQYLN